MAGMKVVVTDFTFPSLDVEESILRPAGFQIESGQCKSAESLIAFVGDADAVITQFAPVKAGRHRGHQPGARDRAVWHRRR